MDAVGARTEMRVFIDQNPFILRQKLNLKHNPNPVLEILSIFFCHMWLEMYRVRVCLFVVVCCFSAFSLLCQRVSGPVCRPTRRCVAVKV